MKRVVVTGATSMIGVPLIKECIQNNVEVLAIVRKNSVHLNRLPQSQLLHVYECDLNALSSIAGLPPDYDVFYHLAWDYTSKRYRDDPVLQEKNIKYTLDAVALAERLGCHKFIGAGSQAEYGRVDHVITPDTSVCPTTAYGISKYAAGKLSEKMCGQHGMVHIWGRIFSVYGRNDNAETMLSYAIDQFIKKESAQFSSATQMWDYLHESDAGKMFFLMGNCVEKNVVYCVANGEAKPLKEFIIQLKECFGKEAVCVFGEDRANQKVFGLQADTSTLIKDTGYIPCVTFQEGIMDMINYKLRQSDMLEKISISNR